MSEEMMNEMNDENIIELVDEDGNAVPFEHLDTVQISGDDYIVCIPYDEDASEVTEIVIFKIDKNEDADNCLSQVVDDDLADQVYQEFKTRNADKFDFEN